MKNVKIINNPIAQNLVTKLRNIKTNSKDFRHYTNILNYYLVYEALSDIQTKQKKVKTQTKGTFLGQEIKENIKFFGVLREGIALLKAPQNIFDHARFDLVGVKRNDDDPFNSKPNVYLNTFKNINKEIDRVVLMDQMLATGGTILILLDSLIKENKFKGKIDIISTIVAKLGAKNIYKKYPKVKITCAGLDEKLNPQGYIYPGLGDAADRYFGMPIK